MDAPAVSLRRLRFRVRTETAESFSLVLSQGRGLPWRQALSTKSNRFVMCFYKIWLLTCFLERVLEILFQIFADLKIEQLKSPVDFDALDVIRFILGGNGSNI